MVTGWKGQAACRFRSDLDWFADVPSDECLTVCLSCPVQRECLSEALSRSCDVDSGVWGATAHMEREAIRSGAAWQRKLL